MYLIFKKQWKNAQDASIYQVVKDYYEALKSDYGKIFGLKSDIDGNDETWDRIQAAITSTVQEMAKANDTSPFIFKIVMTKEEPYKLRYIPKGNYRSFDLTGELKILPIQLSTIQRVFKTEERLKKDLESRQSSIERIIDRNQAANEKYRENYPEDFPG